MKRTVSVALSILLLASCGGKRRAAAPAGEPPVISANDTSPAPTDDSVVATVAGRAITMRQLHQPLLEAYGLNVLLNLVQLELARQNTGNANIEVSEQDIADERSRTIATMFKDARPEDYEQLLDQFLTQQRISEPEFEMVIKTNAHLRKIAEPMLTGKITDEKLQEAFLATYGETVQARHIQGSNLQELAEAKRRLAAGEGFADVAKALSRNARTATLGGELPQFSRQTTGLPQSFKDAAFALQIGEVSDPVEAEGAYHLIKLENRFAPKAVKFEDVKESLREEMHDRMIAAAVKELRTQLAQQALQTLKIEEPTLRRQFDERMNRRESQIRDREQILRELEKQREKQPEAASPERPPATQPGDSGPAPVPTTVPATEPAATP